MSNLITIEGTVVGLNSVRYMERVINCFVSNMQASVVPQPLNLSAYMGKVVGSNSIERSGSVITCYRHGMIEASYLRLSLYEYMDRTITVSGELYGHELYKADIANYENTLKKD